MTNHSKSSIANNRIAKNSILMAVRMILVLIINLCISRVVLINMGISDYGIYGIVGGFVAMIGFVCSTLTNGIQRYYNFEFSKNSELGINAVFNNAIRMVLILSFILGIVGSVIGMWIITDFLNIPSERLFAAKLIFLFSLATFIFHIIQIPFTALITAYEKLNIYAIISIAQSLVTLSIVLLLGYMDVDYLISYGFVVCLIALVFMLQYIIYCRLNFREIYLVKSIDKGLLKKMLTFSGWNIFGAAGNLIRAQGLNIILNIYFGPCINAAREIANQVNSGIQSFVQNIIMPASPQMVKAYADGNVKRSINLFYATSKFSCHILTILSIPVIVEINYILKLWLGNIIPSYADIFTILILLGAYANNLAATASSFNYATGKLRDYQINGATFSIFTLLVVIVGLHYFPKPEMVFLILLITDIAKHTFGFIIVKKIVPSISCKKYLYSVIFPVITTFILALSTAYLACTIMLPGFFRLCVVSSISCLVTLFCLATFALNENEKALFSQMFKTLAARMLKSK